MVTRSAQPLAASECGLRGPGPFASVRMDAQRAHQKRWTPPRWNEMSEGQSLRRVSPHGTRHRRWFVPRVWLSTSPSAPSPAAQPSPVSWPLGKLARCPEREQLSWWGSCDRCFRAPHLPALSQNQQQTQRFVRRPAVTERLSGGRHLASVSGDTWEPKQPWAASAAPRSRPRPLFQEESKVMLQEAMSSQSGSASGFRNLSL